MSPINSSNSANGPDATSALAGATVLTTTGETTGAHSAPKASVASSRDGPAAFSDVSSTSRYLSNAGLDFRFAVDPVKTSRPLSRITVNFERLRVRIAILLKDAFVTWDRLQEHLLYRVPSVTAYIEAGTIQLSCAFIYLLYSHLRSLTSKFDTSNYDIYSKRCTFDSRTELPSGIIETVLFFGLGIVQEFWNNPRVIHVWDNKQPKTYGIDPATAFDSNVLDGFLTILRKCGVNMVRMPVSAPPRTLWDSILIEKDPEDGSYHCMSTFPIENYSHPRDVFISVGLCAPTEIPASNDNPIAPYMPRMQSTDLVTVRDALLPITDDSATTTRATKRRKSVGAFKSTSIDESIPCLPYSNVHPSGVEFHKGNSTTPLVWIYGRGVVDDILPINSLARGITDQEVRGYFRNLFRSGP